MNTEVMFSKKSDDWSTPKDFYNELDKEFNFTFDPCPLRGTEDGLQKDWFGNVFINPPYSNIKGFLEKGLEELNKGNATTLVYLVPARTDTKWFHDYVYNKAEIRFIKGRLKFGESKNSAPFPSMLVIFRKKPYDIIPILPLYTINFLIPDDKITKTLHGNNYNYNEKVNWTVEEDCELIVKINNEYATGKPFYAKKGESYIVEFDNDIILINKNERSN